MERFPVHRAEGQVEKTYENIESLRHFGEGYVSVIEAALGKSSLKDIRNTVQHPILAKLIPAIESFRAQQIARQVEMSMDAQGMLQKAFPKACESGLLSDSSQYRLEEVAPSIYTVLVSPDLSYKLHPGAAASAVKIKNGVSFIYLQEYSDATDQQRNLEENLPHEVHHLVWGHAQEKELFPSSERDTDYRKSFILFQDELLARASSGGGLAGYSHLGSLRPEERAQLEKEYPGKADEIIKRVSDLNGFLYDLDDVLAQSETMKKIDLVQPILEATSFDELEKNLKNIEALLKIEPSKPRPILTGWDAV